MSTNKITVELTEFEAQMAHLVLGLTDNLREPVGFAVQRVVEKLEAAGALTSIESWLGVRYHERYHTRQPTAPKLAPDTGNPLPKRAFVSRGGRI